MASSASDPEQATDSLEIIDLDQLENFEDDEETWLVGSATDQATSSWRKWNMSDDPEVRMKKRSLVEKLDFIAKTGSPTRTPSYYPPPSSRPSMSSTPKLASSRFDSRTFTRPSRANLTFDKETLLPDFNTTHRLLANLSLDSKNDESTDNWKNHTFTKKRFSRESSEALEDDRLSLASSDNSSSHRLNDVGDVQSLARMQEESELKTFLLSSARY